MSSIENSEEVGRNKAKNRSKWYRIKRLCQAYPLGAIGSFIVFLVVFAAVFAAHLLQTLVDRLQQGVLQAHAARRER